MAECCGCETIEVRYTRVLWVALLLNFLMFIIEIIICWFAGSIAIFADSIDFLGDAGNYGASLIALKYNPDWRARIAMAKGIIMGGYGILVILFVFLGRSIFESPSGLFMMGIALLALLVNMFVAYLLYRFRKGDSNMVSVWLCSRNDAIINILVLISGAIIAITHQSWPDTIVAFIIGLLGIKSSFTVIKKASQEMRS
ncbi:MAG: cation transporter [Legionellales bacterium]|nr:cation transporter [Legionellales bacterium]